MLVIVYITFLQKPRHAAIIVLEKDNIPFNYPNIEFSQFKNSFINRCLFKFR